jgi:CO dehydrogenase/acetyl-CoA synthase alpha subunit
MNETGTAPCKVACPAHISIEGYIELAKEGRYAEALELIKNKNPFPAVCGRVCNKRCEDACTRGTIGDKKPVSASMKSRSSSLSSTWMRIRASSRGSSIRNTTTTRWQSSARARRA